MSNAKKEIKDTKLWSNWRIKQLDESILIALVCTIILSICAHEMTANLFISLLLMITAFLFLYQQLVYSKSLKENSRYQIKTYKGSIDDLTLGMYKNGLVLKSWSDGKYMFKTNNWILPNTDFVVKDDKKHCTILGRNSCLIRLQSTINLSNELKSENKNSSNDRK